MALEARGLPMTTKKCGGCFHLLHTGPGAGCYAEDRDGVRFCDCIEEHREGFPAAPKQKLKPKGHAPNCVCDANGRDPACAPKRKTEAVPVNPCAEKEARVVKAAKKYRLACLKYGALLNPHRVWKAAGRELVRAVDALQGK